MPRRAACTEGCALELRRRVEALFATQQSLVRHRDRCHWNGWRHLAARHPSISMALIYGGSLPSDSARHCGGRRPPRDERRGLGWSRHLHPRRNDVVARDGSRVGGGKGTDAKAANSADGNIVAFVSASTNLVVPTTSNRQLFVRNRSAGTTALVSVAPDGLANGRHCSTKRSVARIASKAPSDCGPPIIDHMWSSSSRSTTTGLSQSPAYPPLS